MSKFKVAVFGDRMSDVYYIGNTTRISPEAPIPVVKIERVLECPGGAGNVVANLKVLGIHVHDYTITHGPDEGFPVKSRLMVGDIQIARWDINDRCGPYKSFGQPFDKVDAVVVADYGKGGIDQVTIDRIKSGFKCPIFVDTKQDPSIWSGVATAVFPNWKEYSEFPRQYNDFKGIVVIKKGVDGLQILDAHYDHIESPSQARFVRSVNGCGDTVLSAFVYKYLLNKDFYSAQPKDWTGPQWQDVLDFANAAAAIACESPYTSAPTLEEVNERYLNATK